MTREGFQRQVHDLEASVVEMAELSKSLLRRSVKAMRDLDRDAAQQVLAQRDRLAAMDEAIERELLTFLTLQSPVAKDLRRIGAALKLITYVNRLGRYGCDIAKVARDWPEGREHVAKMVNLTDMATKVLSMLDMTLQAYRDNAAPDVQTLEELEDEVDAMRYSVWREALTYMAEDPANIEPCAHYMMVARYLERCGDNVCKIAEKLHYAATGERLLMRS